MKRHLLFSLLLGLVTGFSFAADATNYGVVVYASGSDVGVQRGTSYREFDLKKDSIIGFSLIEGDLIQTGENTTLEIQMFPTKNVLKISENTSVKMSNLSLAKGSLEVVYGRVRTKVTPLSGGDTFSIKGKTGVAGVRGTDFGVDVIAGSGGANSAGTKTTVYCFSGSVAVTAIDAKATDEPVLVGANQSIEIVPKKGAKQDPKTEKYESDKFALFLAKAIPKLVEEYWAENPIQTQEVNEEEIKQTFPKVEAQAKEESQIVSGEKEGVPLKQVEVVNTKDTAKETIADTIEPIPEFNALELLPKKQYVYGVDDLKLTGMITGGVGIASTLFGILTGALGTDMFGLDSTTSTGLGSGFTIGGISLMAVGSTLFIIGFSNQ